MDGNEKIEAAAALSVARRFYADFTLSNILLCNRNTYSPPPRMAAQKIRGFLLMQNSLAKNPHGKRVLAPIP
jgi:hypothetical protein